MVACGVRRAIGAGESGVVALGRVAGVTGCEAAGFTGAPGFIEAAAVAAAVAIAAGCRLGAPLPWLQLTSENEQAAITMPARTFTMPRCFSAHLRVPLGKRVPATR